jgi:hypothetical protein
MSFSKRSFLKRHIKHVAEKSLPLAAVILSKKEMPQGRE